MSYFDLRVSYDENALAMGDESLSYVCITNEFYVEGMELPKFLSELTRVLQNGGKAEFMLPAEVEPSEVEKSLSDTVSLSFSDEATGSTRLYTLQKSVKEVPGFLLKSGEEKIAYYAVHTPYKLDADGHYFTPEALQKGCERFELIRENIDRYHDFQFLNNGELEVVANFIAKGNEVYTNFDGSEVSPIEGQWIIGIFFKSDELWQGVKNGLYSGVSLFGQGFFEDGDESEVKYG